MSGLAGLAAIGPFSVSATAVEQRKRNIPSTGEPIPVMGLGTARTFDVAGDEQSRAPLREVVRLFVENGGTMIDSSPMYGRAEQVVGELASDLELQDVLFYATKVWTTGREPGIEQMGNSFRLMRTPVIDLMQVHNLVDTQTHLMTIREWIAQKRIRYVGITHYTASAFDDLERLIRSEQLDYVQFPYSIVNRQAEERLIPAAADHGVAVIAHRNFEKGALFRKVRGTPLPAWTTEFDCKSWGHFFLKYLIGDPRVTNVIPATRKPKHLIDNMGAGLGRLPDAAMRRRMVQFVEDL
jgi:diketogulonate reductase-like aldo/keto reductase